MMSSVKIIKMVFVGEGRRGSYWELVQKAIEAAMEGRWREAVSINYAIIEEFPTDVDAYNRLGRALMELGEYEEAIKAYRKALELDPHNKIALKNLARLEKIKDKPGRVEEHRIIPMPFLEEAGKSGIVELINLAPAEILARMNAGEEVVLKISDSKLIVTDKSGIYLGEVESKHARRLIDLMKGGNKYSAVIAELNKGVKVFIWETYQHPSQAGKPSFLAKRAIDYRIYLRETLLRQSEEEAFPSRYLEDEGQVED